MKAFNVFGQDSEWFWVMVQALAVLVTGLFILRQLRLQKNAHLVSSFSILHDRWNSQMMLRARHLVCANYKSDSVEITFQDSLVGMFFEELGGYCRLGHLDIDIAWENYSFFVECYWVMLENPINCFRQKHGNDQSYYHHFERLYLDFREISLGKKVPAIKKTAEELRDFMIYENNAYKFLENTGGIKPSA